MRLFGVALMALEIVRRGDGRGHGVRVLEWGCLRGRFSELCVNSSSFPFNIIGDRC